MPRNPLEAAVASIRNLVASQDAKGRGDKELLCAYRTRKDQAAFSALVKRHGPMVLGVCKRVLKHLPDAEDAFQAAFILLAKHANSLRKRDSLASWLHLVSYRIALAACRAVRRRQYHESKARTMEQADPAWQAAWREVQVLLDEEIQRLPEKYREPFILCCLENLSAGAVGRRLGLKEGTVSSRLAEARKRLQSRLTRRGVALSAVLGVGALAPGEATASLPIGLAASAVRAALASEKGAFAAGLVSKQVAALVRGATTTLLLTKAKVGLLLVLGLGALAGAAGLHASLQMPASGVAPEPQINAEEKRPEVAKKARVDLNGDSLPAGAVARMGTIRFRHDRAGIDRSMIFSPDGKLLVTGSEDEIRLWELSTGKLLRAIRDGYGDSKLLFAPDGTWLAGRLAGHDPPPIRLWSPATGERLRDILADGQIRACSPDGSQLVTAARDGSLSLWDTSTGQRTMHLSSKGPPAQVAFTKDGKTLVTISGATAYHWDLTKGLLDKVVAIKSPPRVQSLCISHDGQRLAVSPRDQGMARILDTATGEELFKLEGTLASGVQGFAFSTDGKILATSQVNLQLNLRKRVKDTEVAFWDASTGKLLRHFPVPSLAAWNLCFAPDNRTLLTAGQQPMVHLWDVDTGKSVHNWFAHELPISALAFTPDCCKLISGSSDGTVRLWDAKSGKHLQELEGHIWGVSSVTVMPNGQTIFSAGNDGCMRLQSLDRTDGRRILLGLAPEGLNARENIVYAAEVSPDGKTAATFDWKRTEGFFYHVWNLSSGKAIVERHEASRSPATRTFSPNATLVLHRVSGATRAASGGGPKVAGGLKPPTQATARPVLEDVATGKQRLFPELPEQTGGVGAFSSDSRSFLTSTFRGERWGEEWRCDNALHLWEVASGKLRQTLACGQGRRILATLSPDGRTVAVAVAPLAIRIYDLPTCKELMSRQGFSSRVECLAFSPDGRSLASGHGDGTILIWRVATESAQHVSPDSGRDQQKLKEWWSDLADSDAGKAYQAIWRLVAAPEQTVIMLREQVHPTRSIPPELMRAVINDLDSNDFSKREAASKQLASLADKAVPTLHSALEAKPSAEKRRRIEAALLTLTAVPPAQALRDLRAVEVLEKIGTPDARQLLEKLAKGAPESRLTQEAKSSLQRLAQRAVAVEPSKEKP